MQAFLGYSKYLLLLILLSSCTHVSYLVEQGVGQLKIQNNAKDNKDVLKDPLVEKKIKNKIRNIEKYKTYFYKYFNEKPRTIYTKTTMLEGKAVSYLVITSKHNEIKAQRNCFPIVGCFPYLGFFKLDSAKDFAKKKKKEQLHTYIRPVYAYSSLGYFQDHILSSFFIYSDIGLTELIFHELFHAIFFVKNEVQMNENLAQFFARELLKEYYMDSPELKEFFDNEKHSKGLRKIINKKVSELKKLYSKRGSYEEHQKILNKFLKDDFLPAMKTYCETKKMNHCWPLKKTWNNASFSEFLTYEEKEDAILALYKKKGLSLEKFYVFLRKRYDEYQSQDQKIGFDQFFLESK